VTPIVLLAHVIWAVDRPRHEPVGNVIRYVVAGALAGGLAIGVEALLAPMFGGLGDASLVWPARFALVFLGVGLVEEACKFVWLMAASRGDRELDEPFDWVVYSVSVALGFALLENVRVLWQGAQAGWARAFFAVPVHALLGTLMGHQMARAMRDGPAAVPMRRRLAVLEPAAWHALYDGLIFQMRASTGFPALLFLLFLGLVAALWATAVSRTAALWKAERGLPPPILAPGRALVRLVRGPAKPGDEEPPPGNDAS